MLCPYGDNLAEADSLERVVLAQADPQLQDAFRVFWASQRYTGWLEEL
jgi:hypothetical protein